MKADAESHADEDQKKRELIELRNQADTLIYTAEKTLSDAGDKADSNLKSDVEEKIKALKEIKDTDKAEEIKTQVDSLSKALSDLGAKMYEQAAQSQPGPEQPQDEKTEGKDTEDKKDENK